MTSIEGCNNKNIPNGNIITRDVEETLDDNEQVSLNNEDAELDQIALLVERKLFRRQNTSLDTMNSIDRDIASNNDLKHIFKNEFHENGVNSIQKPPRQSNVDLTNFMEMKPLIVKNHSEPPSLPTTPPPGGKKLFNFIH